MRIVHISTPNNLVPPQGYGGVERAIHWLASAQLDMGHEVHIVAPGESSTKANIIPIPLWCDDEEAYQQSYKEILNQCLSDWFPTTSYIFIPTITIPSVSIPII